MKKRLERCQVVVSTCRYKFRSSHNDNDNDNAAQCDQIGRFIALWATFQSLWNNYFAQIGTYLGNF